MTAVAPEEAAGEAQTNFHLRITGFRGRPNKGRRDWGIQREVKIEIEVGEREREGEK